MVPYLAKNGYHQAKHTPGLFTHESKPLAFSLIVDDFGVKYVGEENAKHLVDVVAKKYKMTTDWTGGLYCGIKLDWDYVNRTCDLSMPGYVEKALQRFEHPTPSKHEAAPHEHTPIQYGAKVQYAPDEDNSKSLDKSGLKRIQEVVGTLLYYARAIDNTMLPALGSIASEQAHGTERTAKAVTKLLNYAASNPEAKIRFHASDMCLAIDSDASYLSESKARSREAGYFRLTDHPDKVKDGEMPTHNGPILIVSGIMKNVMASAAEAETGASFTYDQEGCPI